MTSRDDDDHTDRLQKFSGATAISSDAFFAEGSADDGEQAEEGRDSLGGQIADKAVVVADKMMNGARAVKNKVGGFLSYLREG